MAYGRQNGDGPTKSGGLLGGKPATLGYALREHDLRLLPLKERCLLRLLYYRGATQGELAGALGVSRGRLRRMLRRAHRRATDPENLAIVRCWRRLTEQEQRVVRLNCFWGLSLREVVHDGLIAMPPVGGRPGSTATLAQLRSMIRAVQRKARRHERRREGSRPRTEGIGQPITSPGQESQET